MFSLEESTYFYLLFLVPILVLVFAYALHWKQKKQAEFGDNHLVQKLISGFSFFKLKFKFILFLLVIIALIFALVNPRFGTKTENISVDGTDIIFCMDVSKSMLAEDEAPNRLEKSKQIVTKVINQLGKDRVGVVAYAAAAMPLLPITTDYGMVKMYLEDINTDMLSSQGTAIEEALKLAMNMFDNQYQNKTIVLLSDGENHENEIDNIVEEIAKKGIKVISIGIGTENGSKIPLKNNGLLIDYKKDSNGETVISKMNVEVLKTIANDTKGEFVLGKNTTNTSNKIIEFVRNNSKKDNKVQVITEYKSQFQWFIGLAFLLLLLDIFISEKSKKHIL